MILYEYLKKKDIIGYKLNEGLQFGGGLDDFRTQVGQVLDGIKNDDPKRTAEENMLAFSKKNSFIKNTFKDFAKNDKIDKILSSYADQLKAAAESGEGGQTRKFAELKDNLTDLIGKDPAFMTITNIVRDINDENDGTVEGIAKGFIRSIPLFGGVAANEENKLYNPATFVAAHLSGIKSNELGTGEILFDILKTTENFDRVDEEKFVAHVKMLRNHEKPIIGKFFKFIDSMMHVVKNFTELYIPFFLLVLGTVITCMGFYDMFLNEEFGDVWEKNDDKGFFEKVGNMIIRLWESGGVFFISGIALMYAGIRGGYASLYETKGLIKNYKYKQPPQ